MWKYPHASTFQRRSSVAPSADIASPYSPPHTRGPSPTVFHRRPALALPRTPYSLPATFGINDGDDRPVSDTPRASSTQGIEPRLVADSDWRFSSAARSDRGSVAAPA